VRNAAGKLLREEGGFTLSEMMVVTMMLTIVLFALYSVFDMSIRVFSFGNDKVEATENARAGLERMVREVRSAYPYDKVTDPDNPKDHVLFASWTTRGSPGLPNPSCGPPGAPATDPANVRRCIVFGNDRPSGSPAAPNWKVDADEVIQFALVGPGPGGRCPATGDEGVCTLVRTQGNGAAQPMVESVMPNGLAFTFFRADRSPATAADGTDAKIVNIRLRVKVGDRAEQTLVTDVELKGRGG
jgi:competence protein ComGC